MKRLFSILVFLILLIGITGSVLAQRRPTGIYQNKYEKLVDFTGHNRLHGFHFAPGLTWMLAPFNDEAKLLLTDSSVTNQVKHGEGRLGFYFEAGMYHLLPYSRYFQYLDWSVAYKNLKGAQDFTSKTFTENTSIPVMSAEGTNSFKYNFITANVNLNSVKQIGNYTFIQHSLGANFDYAIGKNEAKQSVLASSSTFDKMILSLHYKFGIGYKINQKWFIIPSLETPILNAITFEKGRSTINVFDMSYRPLILSIRLTWLRKPKSGDCPPVYGPEGDKARQEKFQMQGR